MPSLTPPDAPLAPTRKTCKLRGFTFPEPIRPDEVPTGDAYRNATLARPYYLLVMTAHRGMYVAELNGYDLHALLKHANRGIAHWTKDGALRHARAMRAINLYCIKHSS